MEILVFSGKAQAVETLVKGAPAQVGDLPTPQVPQESPLTVFDVAVDKTSTNAVVARDEAIAEARRLAFQKLAERNMTPEEYKEFQIPDDKTIATLVQDFEIGSEQLSSTRYVANFTVRFRDAVRNYVDVDMTKNVPMMTIIESSGQPYEPDTFYYDETTGEGVSQAQAEDAEAAEETATTTVETVTTTVETKKTAAPVVSADVPAGPPRKMLVLPYLEGMDGKAVLWEDPNPWRDMWQKNAPKAPVSGHQYFIPLGDVSDVSAGSTDAVWSGDYRAIEKLRRNYGADDVVLAVINRSGPYLTLDLYFFTDGQLMGREVLQPYVGEVDDTAAYRAGMKEVVKFMQKGPAKKIVEKRKTVESITRSLVLPAGEPGIPPLRAPRENMSGKGDDIAVQPLAAAEMNLKTVEIPAQIPLASRSTGTIEASMSFSKVATWMDLQKRLSSLQPSVGLNIRSLSKNSANFTISYAGDIAALEQALASRGVMLQKPSVEVSPAVGGGRPVYSVQLVN